MIEFTLKNYPEPIVRDVYIYFKTVGVKSNLKTPKVPEFTFLFVANK